MKNLFYGLALIGFAAAFWIGCKPVEQVDVQGLDPYQRSMFFSNKVRFTSDAKAEFRDTGLYINSSADGQLDIDADTEVEITATTVDVNGALDVSSGITIAGTSDLNGALDVSGAFAMTGGIMTLKKGSDVASAADGFTLPTNGNYFDVTGTTGIDSIAAFNAGTIVYLQFDSTPTLTDGGNLKLAGNLTASAGDILVLISDGTDWYEVSRSVN